MKGWSDALMFMLSTISLTLFCRQFATISNNSVFHLLHIAHFFTFHGKWWQSDNNVRRAILISINGIDEHDPLLSQREGLKEQVLSNVWLNISVIGTHCFFYVNAWVLTCSLFHVPGKVMAKWWPAKCHTTLITIFEKFKDTTRANLMVNGTLCLRKQVFSFYFYFFVSTQQPSKNQQNVPEPALKDNMKT